MLINIEYMGVRIQINKFKQEITIIENNNNSNKLFNMIFKAILNSVNIDVNDYKIINKIK